MASPLISVLLVVTLIQVCVADVLILYDAPDYQGQSKYIEVADGDTNCYSILDFNDRAGSARVPAGSCWDLYEHAGCMGAAVHATEDIPNLGDMIDRLSSVRQC